MRRILNLLRKIRDFFRERFHPEMFRKGKRTYDMSKMPRDFTHFTVRGESVSENEILVTAHTNNFGTGYLIVLDRRGAIIRYKHLPAFAYAFRKYRLPEGCFYTYMQVDGRRDEANDYAHLCILDENMEPAGQDVYLPDDGSFADDSRYCDAHEYVVLGKDHFILCGIRRYLATDVPGYEGKKIHVLNNVIQEQKAGKEIFRFETVLHPELYAASVMQDQYSHSLPKNVKFCDYAHLNSVAVDPETGDLLCSFRMIGLVKIGRKNGEILWIMGKKRCDIAGVTPDMIGTWQHCARYNRDGSVTVFDNHERQGKSRILRYVIDEKNKTLVSFRAYETGIPWSRMMGSAKAVDGEEDVFQISYGGNLRFIGFEEYDFKNDRQNMKLTFDEGHDIYEIQSGVIDVCEGEGSSV